MNLSRYSLKVQIDDQKEMIYNTRTRKYYIYNKDNEKQVCAFIDNINKGAYTKDEVDLFGKLLNSGIICRDSDDELEELHYHEN